MVEKEENRGRKIGIETKRGDLALEVPLKADESPQRRCRIESEMDTHL